MPDNDALYVRNGNFVYRRIVDEAVLVPIQKDVNHMDCIYTLNEVASFIWEHLEHPSSQQHLQAALLDEYDADDDILKTDLERFLDEMLSIGAISETR